MKGKLFNIAIALAFVLSVHIVPSAIRLMSGNGFG